MAKHELNAEALFEALDELLNCIVAERHGTDTPTYRCEGLIHEAVQHAKEVMGYLPEDAP